MVNLSSVNHSKSWAKNTAWLFGIFTYIYSSHIVYVQVANSRPGGEFMKLPYIKISPYR